MSDIHATDKIPAGRLDDIFETFDQKFSFVLKYAQKNNCVILQAGDMSDSSRNWNILDYYIEKIKVPFYTVFGQHDLYNRADHIRTPTTMLSLSKASKIKLLGKKPEVFKGVSVYGANWGQPIPEPNPTSENILVLHAPISKKEEWSGQDFTHPRYFLRKHSDYDVVLVGDVHRAFKIKTGSQWIVNTGPMLRLEANEYNFTHKPHFCVWNSDTQKMETIEIPHRPAKEVLTREHIEAKKLSKQELDSFANNLKGMKPLADMRKQKIKEYLRKNVKNRFVEKLVMEIVNENRGSDRKIQTTDSSI